jgi:PAS domain S-box-containing protein
MTAHKDRKPHKSSLEIEKTPKPIPQSIHESTAANIAYLASFPELNPNPILELDLEGRLIYLNPAAKGIFPSIDILGVKHPFLVNWSQLVRELRDTKQSKIISREINLGNLIYEQQITLSTKNQIRIYAMDITERKRAEKALTRSETYLQATLNSTGDGILVVDDNQTIISANDHFLEMFGIPRDLIIKKDDNPVLALVVAQMVEPEVFFNKVKELYDSDKIDSDTLHLKDGRIIERYSEPLILQNKIAGRVWSFRDTTELVLAEDGLKRSEEKYRLIVEKSTDIIFSFNGAGEFLYLSPSIKNLLGYAPNDLIGHPFQSLVHPEDFPGLQQAIQRNIKDGSQTQVGNRFRVRHASGDWRWHSTTGNAVYDANGKFVYFMAISRDINDHKKAEEVLQATEQNFRNSLESSFMGIRIMDENDKTLYANPAFLNIFGYSGIDKIGPHPLIDHYTSEEKTRSLIRQEKRLRGEPVSNDIQVEIKGKDGAVLHFQVFLNEIFWNGKKEFQAVYNDVTSLINAEAALKASEQNFRNSVDSSSMGVRIMGDVDHTVYANQALLHMFGYKNIDELNTSPPQEYYTPESRAGFLLRKEQFIRGEALPDHLEFDIIRKDGAIRHLQLSSKNVFWDGKQQFQMLYNDITERALSEGKIKKLLEGESRSAREWQETFDAISDIVAIISPIHEFLRINKAGCEATGKTIEELIGKKCFEIVHGTHGPIMECPCEKALKTKKVCTNEFVDQGRHYLLVAYPIFDNVGEIVAFAHIIKDITVSKKAEEALKESEERYRMIVENTRDMIFTVNADEIYTYVSPAVKDMLGYDQSDLIGKPFISLVHPEDRHIMEEETQQSYIRGYKTSAENEYRIRHASGEWRWVISKGTRVVDTSGNFIYFTGIVRDITEHKQAEEEKQQLEEKAQIASRLAAVGEMAAGIAHEINNPLTSVIGFSQLLLEKQNIPEDIKDDIRVIADGSRRVADIVKRLLTFARQTKPIKTLANLNELIENTLKLRDYVLKTANIEVVKRFDPELPWSIVDPGQLQQVFLNLIVNAEQAMKKAHGKGTLTITSEKKENNILMSFKDDGLGITKENLGHLFEPFFTTKDVGEGTGLGLSLSRSIILEHGGRMSVESEFGHGATFIIEIPIVESPPVEITTSNQVGTVKSTAVKKGKILVVDDEPGVRALLEKVLIPIGYQVDTINDAKIATDKLDAGEIYDVILLDLRMPGMNGKELYAHILEKTPVLKGKVVIVTGDVMGSDVKDFLAKNNLSYLAKPFDMKLLKEKIDAIVDGLDRKW